MNKFSLMKSKVRNNPYASCPQCRNRPFDFLPAKGLEHMLNECDCECLLCESVGGLTQEEYEKYIYVDKFVSYIYAATTSNLFK